MEIEVTRAVVALLLEAARAAGQEECCGLLFGRPDRVDMAQRTANAAHDRARRFEIDPAALIGAARAERTGGPARIGCFHSHPNGATAPSPTDAAAAAPDGAIWAIVAGAQIGWWRAVTDGPVHGRFAPLSARVVER